MLFKNDKKPSINKKSGWSLTNRLSLSCIKSMRDKSSKHNVSFSVSRMRVWIMMFRVTSNLIWKSLTVILCNSVVWCWSEKDGLILTLELGIKWKLWSSVGCKMTVLLITRTYLRVFSVGLVWWSVSLWRWTNKWVTEKRVLTREADLKKWPLVLVNKKKDCGECCGFFASSSNETKRRKCTRRNDLGLSSNYIWDCACKRRNWSWNGMWA